MRRELLQPSAPQLGIDFLADGQGGRVGMMPALPPTLFRNGVTLVYELLMRPVGDSWFSPDAVALSQGSPADYAQRCVGALSEAVQQGPSAVEKIGPRLLGWAVDPRMLFEAWNVLAKHGGQAPGPNGWTYGDFDNSEVWSLLRAISKAARVGKYRRHGALPVSFLKDRSRPERGKRTIWLLDIEDRVVQRAVAEVIQPLLDPHLGQGVFGFRPRLGRIHALAYVEQAAFAEDRFVWLKEDLVNAFDRVPRAQLMEVVAKRLHSAKLVELIAELLKTNSKRGIPQGGPLSPLMLNSYLDSCLDKQWKKKFPEIPQVRYADDLLALCHDVEEAIGAWEELRKILNPTGMKLKGDANSSVFDLRDGKAVEWLGLEIRQGEKELDVRIAERAWSGLANHLKLAHKSPDSPQRAIDMINGWIEQMGPCYPFVDRGEVYDRLKSHAQEQAFDEIPSRSAIRSRWKRAYERYCSLREHGSAGVQPAPIAPSETAATFDPNSTEGELF